MSARRNNPINNSPYLTLAEMQAPAKEYWYMTPTGSAYELNQTGLSGAGPHAGGPKMSIGNSTGKLGTGFLVVAAIAVLIWLLIKKGVIKV